MRFPYAMSVPRMTQLRSGVPVNIVLKADQRTGKLTTGKISDILTRSDHPRGIKVRLTDGQIGRVQSLSSSGASMNVDSMTSPTQSTAPQFSQVRSGQGTRGLQDDYRLDPEPADTSSLLDYVRAPKQKKGKKGQNGRQSEPSDAATLQQQLEAQFPKLDSALIAAILADHGSDLSAAQATLSSLS